MARSDTHYTHVSARLEELMTDIRSGEVFTAEEIADRFDVSYRQANRYAHILADENGDIIYAYPESFDDATDGKTLRSIASTIHD